MRAPLLILCLLTAGCGYDDENVSWFFISNPSGKGFVGGVFVGKKSSSQVSWVVRGSSGTPVALKVRRQGSGTRAANGSDTIWLAVHSDAVIHELADRVELHSPGLPTGRIILPQDTRIALNTDSATLFELTLPKGLGTTVRYRVAWRGNLVLAEGPSGVRAYRPSSVIRSFPSGTRIQPAGASYIVFPPRGSSFILTPTAAGGPETQMAFVAERDSVRFFTTNGNLSAELPSKGIAVQNGKQGLLVTGSYPSGVDGVLAEPFSVLLPLHSHNLVILRDL